MRCSSVRPRLSAYQDHELGRSETTLVEEHLLSCTSCQRLDTQLERATPYVDVMIPPAFLLQLHRRTQVDRLIALSEDPRRVLPPFGYSLRTSKDMDRRHNPLWWLFAASLLLGFGTWLLSEGSAADAIAPQPFTQAYYEGQSETIESGEYQPASWRGEGHARYR